MKAAQEEDRLNLLARLDALAVTADNAEEIGAVRAKLNQTSITRSEFTRLANRVTALESQIADWSEVVSSLQHSVYAVLHWTYDDEDSFITFVGTGFAVDGITFVTNAHIVDALVEFDDDLGAFNQKYGTDFQSWWTMTQNLTADLSYVASFWDIEYYWLHSEWDPDNLYSPDVGLLQTSGGGSIERRATLATNSEVYRLRVGAPIATLGFPGELQGGETEDISPIATFKNGTISALRPPYQGDTYTSRDTYIIQHNLDLSGGTSGSPIFDARGRVVAINNAGIDVIFDIGGRQARVSQAALGFGIRADKIRELLNQASVAAKRTVPAKPAHFDQLVSRLEGRDISSLNIVTTREEFAERLERMR
ncbi:MAG: serine protease [Gemmatimonadetes bacterium]|nr:serine protease [Gemmatimonadota bacterium]